MGTNYKHWIGRLLGSSLRWPEGEIGIISGKLGFRLRCKALATYNHPTNQSILWDVTKCNVSCLLSFHQREVNSDSDEKKCWFISESDASSGLINVFILPICFCTKNLSYFQTQGNFESFRLYLLSSQEWWRKPLKVCSHKNPGFNPHQILSALSHRRYFQIHSPAWKASSSL